MDLLNSVDLIKYYGKKMALDHLTFSIRENEVFSLLGQNGAGKSTTINILTGLIRSDSGTFLFDGHDLKKEPAYFKRNIGFVPQDIAFYGRLTALENTKFFGSLFNLSGRKLHQQAMEALDFVGLSEVANEFPGRFSGGMKRRLNIACSIVHKPRLIIMDEPTVGIDPSSRNHILQSILTMKQGDSTIIYTTHYMEEVEKIADRILILDHGRKVAEGTQKELERKITARHTYTFFLSSTERVDPGALLRLESVCDVTVSKNKVVVSTNIFSRNINDIIAYFTNNRIEILDIENQSISLESTFLALTEDGGKGEGTA
ncbi:ABC transporter ATP-binding protein [Ethanoligenens harbinense]|uniref:ABC transporter related protein n=1 Tax=Ethanoligenens harbinense (strain DSM 18485 / JCM 12961 / CGMCC 1.5033 / YUAN-3) TaxID=663278 RepID=E6U7C4_ETHHY|nr:ATP-binding cassette domain-containing protein [Ethanoligenens harbinense]ADU25859.1 ABC transporter related protein [Ethanoligenens harbinense YUAN-3]AVQ95019.1 export ABC transporter ATP-binding protein [Ethanoligenens harbinense YUAN-3]AYF37712.1 export ABC transporter ATP-binding protein [Ethanoligenens harbinense]AYF40431.1 export ABC transporter ATP-binding protein [Ethanoligenens harbinense]QCN91266.1 ATP-binding cassette domain-containing protein [Ethanoligenens harbinense]